MSIERLPPSVMRGALSPELLAKWTREETDIAQYPLVHSCTEISEADRVRLVRDPRELSKFVIERLDEMPVLIPAIDQTLQKMTRR